MADEWKVEFYVDSDDKTKPALVFLRSLSDQERERFTTRLEYVVQEGLGITAKRNDVLETLDGKGAEGLYSLRLVKGNNARFLLCAVHERRLVILHGFYESNARDYKPAIRTAQARRKALLAAEIDKGEPPTAPRNSKKENRKRTRR